MRFKSINKLSVGKTIQYKEGVFLRKTIGIILAISLLALTVVGCSGDSGSDVRKEVSFADAGWDSNKLHNSIAGLIAEELWGYTWEEIRKEELKHQHQI